MPYRLAVGLLSGFIIALPSHGLADARELSSSEMALIKSAVSESLKDPNSAQYKWQKYNGSGEYCGSVNAKNSYGAYNGFKHFLIPVQLDKNNYIVATRAPIDWIESPSEDFGPYTAPNVSVLLKRCIAASE